MSESLEGYHSSHCNIRSNISRHGLHASPLLWVKSILASSNMSSV